MKKLFDKDAAKRFWNNIKKLFVRKPQNEGAAGKYLKYVSEDSTEWADFPAFLNYKGVKDTYEDLPKSGNVKGDVYTVKDSNAEYFWDQDETWNYIGRLVDMNGYVPLEGDSTITGYIKIDGGLIVNADDGPTLTIGTMKGSLRGDFDVTHRLTVGAGIFENVNKPTTTNNMLYIDEGKVSKIEITDSDIEINLPDKFKPNESVEGEVYSKTILIIVNKITNSGSTYRLKLKYNGKDLGDSFPFTKLPVSSTISGTVITIQNILGYPIVSSENFSYMNSYISGGEVGAQ